MTDSCKHPNNRHEVRDCGGFYVSFVECPDCGHSRHTVLDCSHPDMKVEYADGVYSESCPSCGWVFIQQDDVD